MARAKPKPGGVGERALIASIRARAGSLTRDLQLGIGDDCAVIRPRAGEEIVVTTDFSIEDVHFRTDSHPMESAGHRCLARGLSDLAAMGARPVAAFLSLAAPADWLRVRRGRSRVERFLDGFLALASRFHVPLAGGDTACVRSQACFDVVLLGAVKRGRALLRSGAKDGDLLYVTGAVGGAVAELFALRRSPGRFARFTRAAAGHPHLYPEPRLAVASHLVGRIHAAIDVSDGLSTDLEHLCEESGLSAELDAARIPVHALAVEAVRSGLAASSLDLALHGGDDYELLFTASPGARIPHRVAGVAVHRIGRMRRSGPKPQMTLRDVNGRTSVLEPRGWEHFRS